MTEPWRRIISRARPGRAGHHGVGTWHDVPADRSTRTAAAAPARSRPASWRPWSPAWSAARPRPGPASCSSGWTTATTRRWCGSTAARAIVATADFFTPVVDDAYDWGRIAAANALSDVYAMGGTPVVAVNLLGWPRDVLPMELAAEVLRGGLDVAREAGCHVAGGHSVDDPEPKYGMAVTGVADPDRLLRNDAGAAGLPLTLTKPLGIGVLNSRHKATGEVVPAGGRGDDRAQPGRRPRPRWPPGSAAPPT